MQATVEMWLRELREAGWVEVSATVWRSPDGWLYRGPLGAWKALTQTAGYRTAVKG